MPPRKKTVVPTDGVEWQILARDACYDAEKWQGLVADSRSRVDSVRRRDVEIRLVDRRGAPLRKRRVNVAQTRSDFLWGFGGWGLMNAMARGEAGRDPVARQMRLESELFNSVNCLHYWQERVCEDAPVSEETLGYPDYDNLDEIVSWAMAHNMTPKGHPLFWPVDKAIPEWVGRYDYATKMKFLEVRIRAITSRFKGRIRIYDAVNEPIWEPSFARTHERHWPHLTPIKEMVEYIEPVLRWAREEDPDARYLINDYGIHVGDHGTVPVIANDGTWVTRDSQARRYQELILALAAAGAAPDGVGIQGFAGAPGYHAWDVDTIDLLGTQTGLPVYITEFCAGGDVVKALSDAGAPREEITERMWAYTENAMTVAFAHPAVEGFYFWYNTQYLFARGGRPSSLYRKMDELLNRTWRTDEEMVTDGDGVLRFRGFCGDYALRVAGTGTHRARSIPFSVPGALRGAISLELAL